MSRILGQWKSRTPAYLALAGRVRTLISDGRLTPQTQIPPERALAQQLGISRTTVTKAYDLLRAEGRVHSSRGSGTLIAFPARAFDPDPAQPGGGPAPAPWALDFGQDALTTPRAALDALVRAAAPDIGEALAASSPDPQGLPALRELIARQYEERGVPTSAAHILLTRGPRHTLRLLLRALVRPAQPVVVEAPARPETLDTVHRHGARPTPVALTERGWNVELLASVLRQSRAPLALITPDFQHPTGHVLPDEERAFLVRTARRAGTVLVADDSAAALGFDPGAAPHSPPAAHDTGENTVQTGSPRFLTGDSVRVGWIRAQPALIQRLSALEPAAGAGISVTDQVLVLHALRQGPAWAAERRHMLRARRDALAAALAEELPEWRFVLPAGGTALWVDLGAPVSGALVAAAHRHRLRLLSGSRFSTGGAFENRLRLPFTLSEDELRTGAGVLARAFAAVPAAPAVREGQRP